VIVTIRVALRLALLIFVAAILQVSFFSQITVLGAAPDVMPVVIVAIGLLGGAVIGASCGFAAGLLLDVLLLQTLGVSSLVLLIVGWLAGRYRESFEIGNAIAPILLAGALTMVGASIFTALQLMLGVEAPVSLLIVREIVVKAVLGLLLAIPIYPGVRRLLRVALVEDLPRRRALGIRTPLRTSSLARVEGRA
jgi:rod shape-determining protein MreD